MPLHQAPVPCGLQSGSGGLLTLPPLQSLTRPLGKRRPLPVAFLVELVHDLVIGIARWLPSLGMDLDFEETRLLESVRHLSTAQVFATWHRLARPPSRVEVCAVPCPDCGAAVGSRCVGDRKTRMWGHRRRIGAYISWVQRHPA